MQSAHRITAVLIAGCLLFVTLFSACGKDKNATFSAQAELSVVTESETESQSDVAETFAADTESAKSDEVPNSPSTPAARRGTGDRQQPNAPATATTGQAKKPKGETTTLPPLSAVPQGLLNNWTYHEKIPPRLLFNGDFLEGLDFHMDWELEVLRLYYADGSYSKIVHEWNGEAYLQALTDARVRQAERENGAPLNDAQKEQLARDTERMLWQMEDAEEEKGTFTANDTTIFYNVNGQRYTETYRLSGEELTITASSVSNYGLPRTMYCYYK